MCHTKNGEAHMAKYEKTRYPGVYSRLAGDGTLKIYIYYRLKSKRVFEKTPFVVTPGKKGLTPTKIEEAANKAARLRADKAEEKTLTNSQERRIREAEAGKWTIDKLWEGWKADPENQGKRGTLKADYRYRKHLKGSFGNKEPQNIAQIDVDRLRLSLAKTHAKETTRSVISLLVRIIRYGATKGYNPVLSFPVVLKGKQLGKDPEIKRAPTDAEIAAYVKTCQEWPDIQAGNFQLFMVYTGIRRGSARNLKWSDICFESGSATLQDSKTGTISVMLGKGALELLRKHPRTEGVEYVFSGRGPDGIRSDREIGTIPPMIRDAAGLPKDLDPCHMFRRNLATKLDRHGKSTVEIMSLGGWKSPAMVLHYTATEKETIREAADLLTDIIRKAEEANG